MTERSAPLWTGAFSLEERLKLLLPPRWYRPYLLKRAKRKGEPELNLIPFLCRRDRISLDVGANKGIYAEAMRPASLAVHAFEPNPKMLRVLRRLAHPSVVIHPIGLSDRTGTADLLIPWYGKGFSNQGASLSDAKAAGEHAKVTIDTRRIDDLALGPVGCIKIDVEGFEQSVIAGATQTLRRDRPTLLVEIEEHHTGRRLEDDLAAICAHGYRAYALVEGQLTDLARIDLDLWHRQRVGRPGYLFNFIFLPGPDGSAHPLAPDAGSGA